MNHLQNSHRLFAQVGVTFSYFDFSYNIASNLFKVKRENSCNKIYYVLEFCLFFRSQFSNTCTLCLCALGLLSYLTSICTTWIFFFFFFTLRFMVRLSVLLVTNLYSLNNFYEQIKKKLQMNVASYFEYIHCLVHVFRTAVI